MMSKALSPQQKTSGDQVNDRHLFFTELSIVLGSYCREIFTVM